MINQEKIQLAHGGGGLLSSQLIQQEIISRFGNDALKDLPDAASLQLNSKDILFSTDSFVVHPFEFPGGNIGDLAVHGTVNDISVAGGHPLYLSMGLILEEGFPIATLQRILDSVKKAIDYCNVKIVTGDTKVVGKGQCDGIYINTAGIAEKLPNFNLGIDKITIGDKILISGNIAEHGAAILTARENLQFESNIKSDSASVHKLVKKAYSFANSIKFMRDPTRGGLAAVLNEIVENQSFGIKLKEESIPVSLTTQSIVELLGLDPLHIASEGRIIAICAEKDANALLSEWQKLPEGKNATIIGEIIEENSRVILETFMGGNRLVTPPHGELLPRIC